MNKKQYNSPLFEEIVLEKEVLAESNDILGDGNGYAEPDDPKFDF